jgi:predicted transcriptional regulator
MKKQATSIRMSPEAKTLLLKLAQHWGVSQSAALELAIRKSAEAEHLRKQA